MTEIEENEAVGTDFMSSKFGRTLLTILAVFLIFAGPTYVVYGLAVILKVNFAASLVTGFVLLVLGLVMMRYLVQKKIIT